MDFYTYIAEYREFKISDATITLSKMYNPSGSGRSNNTKIVNKPYTRSVVQIHNDDTLCCVKSIIVCMAHNYIEMQLMNPRSKLNFGAMDL